MKTYRIIFESFETGSSEIISKRVIMQGSIKQPKDMFSLGFSHTEQIDILQSIQDTMLNEQSSLFEYAEDCPHCENNKLVKNGKYTSSFHDVFTDHKLTLNRYRCKKCGHETAATVFKILGTTLSGDLMRLQTELGSNHSYRESEQIFTKFSAKDRAINNHDRIKGTLDHVGAQVIKLQEFEKETVAIESAKELIVNVDGGHIKSIEDGKRSFEAMTAVIYRPEAIVSNSTDTKNYLTSKHCAASAKSDNNKQMISSTIIAALKQGLSPKTTITALCDGAENCWQVVDALKPLSGGVTSILDWFHLAMKIQNISLLDEQTKLKLTKIKWHLWRGRVDNALIRLSSLIQVVPQDYKDRLEKLQTYLKNNTDKIVNYRERQKQGLVFTSNLAESTVESLINQRCKGQQHMRWSREGIEPILQVRAAIASNDWNKIWKTAILNSVTIH
jgi:hypothetical protein